MRKDITFSYTNINTYILIIPICTSHFPSIRVLNFELSSNIYTVIIHCESQTHTHTQNYRGRIKSFKNTTNYLKKHTHTNYHYNNQFSYLSIRKVVRIIFEEHETHKNENRIVRMNERERKRSINKFLKCISLLCFYFV